MPTLNWIGKEQVANHDKEVPFRLLKKVKSLSVGENSQNLIIHGDNLEGLKAIMPYYYGKIKCIYIDPPYNTGNESWVYNDKVNSPKIKKWLGKVVGGESEDLCRHDKWLCMMYPRLKLLRDLLSDDGVIFISIDDNESHNLRQLMNEIFGENKFVGEITRKQSSGSKNDTGNNKIITNVDKLLVYARGTCEFLPVVEKNDKKYPLSDSKGEYSLRALEMQGGDDTLDLRPKMGFSVYYNEKNKDMITKFDYSLENKNVYEPVDSKLVSKGYQCFRPRNRRNKLGIWRWGSETFIDEFKKGNVCFQNGRIFQKERKKDFLERYPDSLCLDFINTQGTLELKELFEDKDIFDFPKPVSFIKKYILHTCTKNDIILDSFAGSGTTGHAVMQLNKEDNGSRKFILIEMEDTVAKEITSERIKRAIKKENYNDGFEFCELDKPLFNEEGQIEEECSYEQLANYVYFTETQTNIDKKQIQGSFIGSNNERNYYLIFKEKGKNILNKSFLKNVKKDEKNIIYADKCLLDEDTLTKFNVEFKQIPYEVRIY